MMIKLIVVSHGDLAQALVEASRLIVGEAENLCALGLHPGDSVEDFTIQVKALAGDTGKDSQLLFLCDVMAGSPFNAGCTIAFRNPNVKVLYGVNLPLLMEAVNMREDKTLEELATYLMEIAPELIGVAQTGGV